jgi:lipopolysaccharide export system protein LptA
MRRFLYTLPFLALVLILTPAPPATAQEATVAFQGLKAGAGQPVEITADELEVIDKDGQARFTGNVVVIQGDLRLSAQELVVDYVRGEQGKIDQLRATGDVLLSTPSEAAEAAEATYSMTDSQIDMSGDVLLTQGDSVITGQHLVIDLNAGTGRMEGRVKTVLQPGGN